MALDNIPISGLHTLALETPQFIGGNFEAGGGDAFDVLNPSTEEVYARIASAASGQVLRAITGAKNAALAWGALNRQDRVAQLRRFVDALRAQTAELTQVLINEAGCASGPHPAAFGVMAVQTHVPMRQAGEILDLYLGLPEFKDNPLPLAERVTPLGKQMQSILHYTPVGVVASIAAYNFPIFTAVWKVLPALATGNTVILRPSPLTPISALIFARAAARAELPPGVLNVILEGGLESGQLMTSHPDVDMVSFTGSTGVGIQIMKQAADTMKRLQLELGGKSAQIFLPDAADQAAAAAPGVCLSHAGQGCVLGTRVFVPEASKAKVLEGMKAALANVKIGNAADPETVLGPLISAAQVARCERFVGLAVEAGARIVTGGKRPAGIGPGFFFEPTVLDTPDNNNPAAREEIFGPVVSVIGYRDLDHAVEMANDSDYGLSGYVFGADKRKAMEIASRLKTGAVNVNGGMMSSFASGGGHKLSGVGRERGEEGIRAFQQMTSVNIGA